MKYTQSDLDATFDSLHLKMLGRMSRMTHDRDKALEIIHSSYIHALEHLDACSGSLSGWLYRILTTQFLTNLRRADNRHEQLFDEIDNMPQYPMYTTVGPSPEYCVWTHELREIINESMASNCTTRQVELMEEYAENQKHRGQYRGYDPSSPGCSKVSMFRLRLKLRDEIKRRMHQ